MTNPTRSEPAKVRTSHDGQPLKSLHAAQWYRLVAFQCWVGSVLATVRDVVMPTEESNSS